MFKIYHAKVTLKNFAFLLFNTVHASSFDWYEIAQLWTVRSLPYMISYACPL